jgi:hypothetical protein
VDLWTAAAIAAADDDVSQIIPPFHDQVLFPDALCVASAAHMQLLLAGRE